METKIEFIVLTEEQATKVVEYLNGVSEFTAKWEKLYLIDHYVYNIIVISYSEYATPVGMLGNIATLFACEIWPIR